MKQTNDGNFALCAKDIVTAA